MRLPIFKKHVKSIANVMEDDVRAYVNYIEVCQKWMEESFAVTNVQSHSPIEFEDGDFIIYDGRKYTLSVTANVKKKSSAGSVGDAFVYENIRFDGPEHELLNVLVLDFVVNDNKQHYSWLPNFSTYCENINDFIDVINANLERCGMTNWRMRVVGEVVSAFDVEVSFSNESVLAALRKVNDIFRTNYTIDTSVDEEGNIINYINVGTRIDASTPVLTYGKGNGLIDIRKNISTDNIITRLYVYGSSENFNPLYYTGRYVKRYDGSFGYVPIDKSECSGSIGKLNSGNVTELYASVTKVKRPDDTEYDVVTPKMKSNYDGLGYCHIHVENYIEPVFSSDKSVALFDIVSKAYLVMDEPTGGRTISFTLIGNRTESALMSEKSIINTQYIDSAKGELLVTLNAKKNAYLSNLTDVNDRYIKNCAPVKIMKHRVRVEKKSKSIEVTSSRSTQYFTFTQSFVDAITSETVVKFNLKAESYNSKNKLDARGTTEVSINVLCPSIGIIRSNDYITSKSGNIVFNGLLAPNAMAINNLMLPTFGYLVAVPGKSGDPIINLDTEAGRKEYENSEHALVNPSTKKTQYVGTVGYISEGRYYRAVYENGERKFNYNVYLEADEGTIEKYGLKEGCVFFDRDDFDNGITNVKPSITGMKTEDVIAAGYDISVRNGDNGFLDEVLIGAAATDGSPLDEGVGIRNGETDEYNLPDGQKQFRIYIKDPGFDILDYINNNDPSITFNTGGCAGRTFTIVRTSIEKVLLYCDNEGKNINTESGEQSFYGYTFRMSRTPDENLNNTYFPNSRIGIAGVDNGKEEKRGDEIVPSVHGDQFVITGLLMPRVYVEAAAMRLKSYGEEYLREHSRPKFNVSPTIDSIFMQRNYDEVADKSKSLRYQLQAGVMMSIKDDDLGFENGVDGVKLYISSYTIKEGKTPLPEYSVELREEKEYSLIQRIQGNLGIVSGVSIQNVQSQSFSVAMNMPYFEDFKNKFLSKDVEDTASEHITFAKGLSSLDGINVKGESVIDEHHSRDFNQGVAGHGHWVDEDGKWHMETDYLNVRIRQYAKELQIEKTRHIGAELMLTAAQAEIDVVIEKDDRYLCYFLKQKNGDEIENEWVEGDLAFCETHNLVGDDGGSLNHRFWREVIEVGDGSYYDEFADSYNYHCIVLSKSSCESGSDAPLVGDNVVQLGNKTGDIDRVGCTIISGAGSRKGNYLVYESITGFNLPEPRVQISPKNVKIVADKFEFVSKSGEKKEIEEYVQSSTTDAIEKQLDQKFDIWQLTEHEAPLDDKGEIVTPITMLRMAAYDSRLMWTGTEAEEHVGDFVLFGDGVCYQFTERYEWHLISDTYLISYVEQLVEQRKKISDMESDSKVTPMEKQQLLTIWNQEKSEHDEIINPGAEYMRNANVLSKRVAYNTIYNAVDDALTCPPGSTSGGILYDLTTTTDLTTFVWPSQFSSISEAFAKLDTAKAAYKKALTDFAKDNGATAAEKYVTESGLTIDNLSATLWSTLKDSSGKLVSQAIAETYVTQEGLSGFRVAADHIDFSSSVMNLEAGKFTITSDNFSIDEDGIATVRGLVKKGHLAINALNFTKYFKADVDPIMGRRFLLIMTKNIASANYIDIGWSFVMQGNNSAIMLPWLNRLASPSTEEELDSIRDYIGQQVVIYNRSENPIDIEGLFFSDGYYIPDPSNPNIGQWIPPRRDTSLTIPSGSVAALECKAVGPGEQGLLSYDDKFTELIWWKPYITKIATVTK